MGGANSGRRSAYSEKSVEELCSLSHDILIRWLNNSAVSDDRKVSVVLQILLKRIPTKLEHSGDLGSKIVIVRAGDPAFNDQRETIEVDGRIDNKVQAQAVAGQVCIQQEEVSGDVLRVGDGQDNVLNISGCTVQRADT